ncbi:MAG: hypothetical protein H0U45_06275 [Tatlockia sp.]|nr:hypothetical protein [Tatlockia sp.]
MKIKFTLLPRLVSLILPIGLLVCPNVALAFDTGHHSDLTREALQDEGFSNTPIEVAQVENWLVDYFSSSPTSQIKSDVEKLHFDNLFSTSQIRNYWGQLTVNTKNAVQQAARENDPLKCLAVLGISLHAVQDFYTHSNWVETHPPLGNAYRTDTWFDSVPLDNLFTGSYPNLRPGAEQLHGDYNNGLNHDSYVRPRWEQSYVFAYAASRQWVNAVHSWVNEVNPSFWQSVQKFEVSGADRSALDFDLEAAYRISEWIAVSGADGHWKGNRSGSNTDFVPFALRWATAADSQFLKEFKVRKIHRLLSENLSGDSSPVPQVPPTIALPTVPHINLDRRAIIVRTLHVAEKDDVGLFEQKIDPLGKADFYAKITVAGQTFTEAMQLDRSDVSPAWSTIKFIPTALTSVSIHYELWDEDGGTRGDDDHCDINQIAGKQDLDLTFLVGNQLLAGDIAGVRDSESNAVQSEGRKPDKDRAIVRFYVTEQSLNFPAQPAASLPTRTGVVLQKLYEDR